MLKPYRSSQPSIGDDGNPTIALTGGQVRLGYMAVSLENSAIYIH